MFCCGYYYCYLGVCVHECVHVCLYVVHECVCVHVHLWVDVCVYVCVWTCVYMNVSEHILRKAEMYKAIKWTSLYRASAQL